MTSVNFLVQSMFFKSKFSSIFIECQPGLPDGNFIMFASATSGDKVNNAKFSPCSVANISSVLHVVLQSVPIDPTRHAGPVGALMKRNCFQGTCFDILFFQTSLECLIPDWLQTFHKVGLTRA